MSMILCSDLPWPHRALQSMYRTAPNCSTQPCWCSSIKHCRRGYAEFNELLLVNLGCVMACVVRSASARAGDSNEFVFTSLYLQNVCVNSLMWSLWGCVYTLLSHQITCGFLPHYSLEVWDEVKCMDGTNHDQMRAHTRTKRNDPMAVARGLQQHCFCTDFMCMIGLPERCCVLAPLAHATAQTCTKQRSQRSKSHACSTFRHAEKM